MFSTRKVKPINGSPAAVVVVIARRVELKSIKFGKSSGLEAPSIDELQAFSNWHPGR